MLGRLWAVAVVLLIAGCSPGAAQERPAVQSLAQDEELRNLMAETMKLFAAGKDTEAAAVLHNGLAIAEGRYGPDHMVVGEALAWMAYVYLVQGQSEEAERLQKRALTIFQRALASSEKELSDRLFKLAFHYYADHRYAAALPIYELALGWAEKAFGPNAPELHLFLDRLADVYKNQGRYTDAQRLYQRALSVSDQLPDDVRKPLTISTFFARLAEISSEQGYLSDSKALLERAHDIIGKSFERFSKGPHSNMTIAGAYQAQGRYAEAEALYSQELARLEKAASDPATKAAIAALQEKLQAMAPPKTGDESKALESLIEELGRLWATVPTEYELSGVLHRLGGVYDKLGKYVEAEALYRQQLARIEQAASDPATKAAIAALQEKLEAMGPPKTAEQSKAREPLSKELWRLRATVPSEEALASLLHVLGGLSHKLGKYAEAEAFLSRAIGIAHGDMSEMSLQLSFARLYADQGRHADAEKAYMRVLAFYEEVDRLPRGKLPSPITAGILQNLGRLALKQQQPQRAEELHKRALKILEDLGPDRFDVGGALNELAELYRGQRRFAQAEPLLKRALAICANGDMSPNHELVRTVLTNLAALYQEQGRHEDADRIRRGAFTAGQRP
jgi:tetratricopeptide (TPR) repeat protein